MRSLNTRFSPFTFLFLMVLLLPAISMAQAITRGPYLQRATFDGVTICWRTDTPSDSRISYGASPGNLTNTFDDPASVTDHFIHLTGLSPNQTYYYSIGTTTNMLAGDDSLHFFEVLPPQGQPTPVRFWAIGDFGKGNDNQKRVRDSYMNEIQTSGKADGWIWLGDNAYTDGTDQEYQDHVFDSTNGYPAIFPNTILWPTPGNHDYNSVNVLSAPPQHTGPYFDIVEVPTNGESGGLASGYELYYSYDYGNVHLLSLNSEITTWNANTNSDFFTWLNADLTQNQLPWVIAYFHQPPHTKGSHDSDDFWEIPMAIMRTNVMPVLEQYGVDVILSGHSHSFERSFLVEGHYGNSGSFDPNVHGVSMVSGIDSIGETYYKYTLGQDANRGSVYAVVGNGGSTDDDGELNHPMMYTSHGCDTCIGSLLIDVTGNRLDGTYLTGYGEKLDAFTIVKSNTVAIPENMPVVENLELFPNPFDQVLRFRVETSESSRLKAEIYDMSGKRVYQENLGLQDAGIHTGELDLSLLPIGNYVFSLKTKRKRISEIIRKEIR